MSVLSDHQIRKLATERFMIEPFSDEQLKPGVISYGVSSYGYDIRVGNKFRVFDNFLVGWGKSIDPKSTDWHSAFTEYHVEHGNYAVIPPNSFALAESMETFNIPRDILVLVLGKSTYARCGVIVNVTPGEPEWRGKWTIEVSNTTPLPAKIYAGEGIAQAIFLQASQVCERSYADKKGRYNDQKGLTLPFVRKEDPVMGEAEVYVVGPHDSLDVNTFNNVPFLDKDKVQIGVTRNARLKGNRVVVDVVKVEPK